ncbi:hypothetical protein SESBI_26155 [Sesbania bispinosa]|nr:hypothetical protein SESBI_26155 [Sesbania bispinosa]
MMEGNTDDVSNGPVGAEDIENEYEDAMVFENEDMGFGIDCEDDFINIDPGMLGVDVVMKFHFANIDKAYEFYNWYGLMKGISARRRMLPAHRRINESDKMQMSDMWDASISTPQIYGSFACQSGGFEHIGFRKKDMYNELSRKRKLHGSDVEATLKWERMVKEFGLEENSWVKEMYDKRNVWATTYIKGNFFAGFRTTSRCEGLNAQLARFVHSRHKLIDFLHNFVRCLEALRYKEIEADFASAHGEVVLQTNLKDLERSASKMFTREVFMLVHPAIARGSTIRVKNCTQLMSQSIYTISKYGRPNKQWHVSFLESPMHIKFSCQMMETFGLPCDHIIGIMVHLNIEELPRCLVLDRWTMGVKDKLYEITDNRSTIWDSVYMARCAALDFLCKKMNKKAGQSSKTFNVVRDLVTRQIELMNLEDASDMDGNDNQHETGGEILRDPIRVGTKGYGVSNSSQSTRRRHKCSKGGGVGHNRTTCTKQRGDDHMPIFPNEDDINFNDEMDADVCTDTNVDI